MNSVEQRSRTIVRIVEAVLELQKDYFEGNGNLVPMQQEDIAQLLGIHFPQSAGRLRENIFSTGKPFP